MPNSEEIRRVILVAEDDEDDFSLLVDAHKRSGAEFEMPWVKDGEELMDHLKTLPPPDLILLDLNMPRKDGREALKEIRAHQDWKKIPVVIFTTSNSAHDVENAYANGANTYIRKPGGFRELIELVKNLETYWFKISETPCNSPKTGKS